jgi:hypothetical protein
LQPPFSIFKTRDDGGLHFVEGAKDLEAAKDRVAELSKSLPWKYVIVNEETGEKLCISTGDERVH